jgi:hypothetical protein
MDPRSAVDPRRSDGESSHDGASSRWILVRRRIFSFLALSYRIAVGPGQLTRSIRRQAITLRRSDENSPGKPAKASVRQPTTLRTEK